MHFKLAMGMRGVDPVPCTVTVEALIFALVPAIFSSSPPAAPPPAGLAPR
jgi:hypothetical protein